MSKHVAAANYGRSDLTMATTLEDAPELGRGPWRPFSIAVVANDQPPPVCNPATLHFGASDRQEMGSASRLFWSRSAQLGSQLWALPMQGDRLCDRSTFAVDAMEPLMPRDPGNIGAAFAVQCGRLAFPSPFPPTEDQ